MNRNTSPGIQREPLLYQFFCGFRAVVQGPYNSWVTGVAVGHPPTEEEKLVHFVTNGGHTDYRRRFQAEHPEVDLG